jgi:hypothetical protein
MPTYRVYFLDKDEHIKAVEVITCADDAAARREATGLLDERRRYASVEVWRERDRVEHIRRE